MSDERLGGWVGQNRMQEDIDDGHFFDHGHLSRDRLEHRLARVRKDHVANGSDATCGG